MELNYSNFFSEINGADDLADVNGGVAFIPILVAAAKIIGGCAVVGFAGGCIYECILGWFDSFRTIPIIKCY